MSSQLPLCAKVLHLELGIEVIRLLVVHISAAITRDFGVGRQAGLGADIVQIDQQRLVLPAVGHRGVAPHAVHAADVVGMKGMQVVALAAAKAAVPVVAVAVRVGSCSWHLKHRPLAGSGAGLSRPGRRSGRPRCPSEQNHWPSRAVPRDYCLPAPQTRCGGAAMTVEQYMVWVPTALFQGGSQAAGTGRADAGVRSVARITGCQERWLKLRRLQNYCRHPNR